MDVAAPLLIEPKREGRKEGRMGGWMDEWMEKMNQPSKQLKANSSCR